MGLERGVRRLLSERAKEMAGVEEFTLKLRVDGTLEVGVAVPPLKSCLRSHRNPGRLPASLFVDE